MLAIIIMSLSAGCFGSEDEGCVVDAECYVGRVCMDGWCVSTGTNPTSSNDAGADMNGSNAFNDLANNTPSNNTSSNNTMNNEPEPPPFELNNVTGACETAFDCDGTSVCSSDTETGELACLEGWDDCESSSLRLFVQDDGSAVCSAEFYCAVDWLPELRCEFPEEGASGICVCGFERDGIEFEARYSICTRQNLVDAANIKCGYRAVLSET